MKDRSNNEFNLARFRTIVEAYGADRARWPDDERVAALSFAERSPEAKAILREAARLDRLLDRARGVEPSDGLLRAISAIPDQHPQTAAPGAGPALDAADARPELSGWRLWLPFDAAWKPALGAAAACLLGIVTGVATLEPATAMSGAQVTVANAAETGAATAGNEAETDFDDLTRLAFAADVDEVFASLTDVSDLGQEPQP
jgi:hypothetical protein